MAVDPGVAAMFVLMLGLAGVSLTVGVYLLLTDPPADPERFIGVGSEKLPDEEFE